MERMVGDLVFGNVIKCILQSPVSKRVALGQSTSNGGILELINPRPLKSLPPRSSVNHTISVASLQSPLERLNLAHLIILLNVLLPKIGTELGIVRRLVSHRHALGTEDLGLESVKFLNLPQEVHGLGKKVEGINDHNLGHAVLQISHAVEQVRDDGITGNQGVGENGIAVVLASDFKGEHGLFLEVLEAHFFGFGDEGFLIEDLGIVVRHGECR
mmetsp:Transcript_6238/g.10302  ORF Transcript_6238/g.10302 Transcript_6238/m.10302 type:complete len:215 (+) Transcript_6238:676-1320(+)